MMAEAATAYPAQILPEGALSFSQSGGLSGPPAIPFLSSLCPLAGEHFTANPWLELLGVRGDGGVLGSRSAASGKNQTKEGPSAAP